MGCSLEAGGESRAALEVDWPVLVAVASPYWPLVEVHGMWRDAQGPKTAGCSLVIPY